MACFLWLADLFVCYLVEGRSAGWGGAEASEEMFAFGHRGVFGGIEEDWSMEHRCKKAAEEDNPHFVFGFGKSRNKALSSSSSRY